MRGKWSYPATIFTSVPFWSSGLCTIPRIDVLASTAFDGTLRLWDLYRMCERKQLRYGVIERWE
jgi:hypothetical protein